MESYIDCGNRDAFEDQVGELTLHPTFAPALAAYTSLEDGWLAWVVAGRALEATRGLAPLFDQVHISSTSDICVAVA